MEELTPRTAFLLEHKGVIIATGSRLGVPRREMDDFVQEVLMKSVRQRDGFDPNGAATLLTYATQFVEWCARRYLTKECAGGVVVDSNLVEMVLENERVRDGQSGENCL